MTNQPWMIFKPEAANVFYMWNGKFPIIIHNQENALSNEPWYWSGPTTMPLSDEEVQLLNDMAAAKRKQLFKVPRKKDQRFVVVQRGVFEKQQ